MEQCVKQEKEEEKKKKNMCEININLQFNYTLRMVVQTQFFLITITTQCYVSGTEFLIANKW